MTDDIAHMRVLAVTPSEQEAKELHAIFAHSRWRLDTVGSPADALNFLRAETVPVLICDINLPDGSWQDMMRALAHLNDPPRPIVVAPCAASSLLWLDALKAGACDVLERPFDLNDVFGAVTFAWQQLAFQTAADAGGRFSLARLSSRRRVVEAPIRESQAARRMLKRT